MRPLSPGYEQEMLLNFFKAMADENRLTMFRMLSQSEHHVGALAEALKLTEPTVSHHLSKLRAAGLVTLRTSGNQRFYRLNSPQLQTIKKLIANIEVLPTVEKSDSDNAWIDALDMSEEDRKVLRDCTHDGRLKEIPRKQKKLMVVLRWLATCFQPETKYTEREVNSILLEYHQDYASLRRDLVDFGFLRRERGGGLYWVTPENESA